MANEQSKKEKQNQNENQNKNNEDVKEKFPQIIVGVIAVIAIIFGLFYFNNQNDGENEQANAEQEATEETEEGEVGGANQEEQGNVAPTQEPIPEDQTEYTVQEGDSLWSIAQRRYGSGYNYVDIIDANHDVLPNPDSLAVGQTLTLPDVQPPQSDTAMADEPTEEMNQDEQTDSNQQNQETDMQTTEYTVQQGDSLAIISEKVYGTQENWQRIAEANAIMNPDHIAVGMKLMIPRK